MKKILSVILVLVFTLTLCAPATVLAEDKVDISVDSVGPYVQGTAGIKIYVRIDSVPHWSAIDISFTFDPDVLEYKSFLLNPELRDQSDNGEPNIYALNRNNAASGRIIAAFASASTIGGYEGYYPGEYDYLGVFTFNVKADAALGFSAVSAAVEKLNGLSGRTPVNLPYAIVTGGVTITCDHDWAESSRQAATCEEDGWIEYTCSKCSDTYREPLTAIGHDYAAVVTPATCEAGGYTTYTCRHDAEHTYIGAETEALGHDWGEWDVTTEAGCETAGEETRVCNHDGTHIETRDIAATGHSWAESSRQAATCEADGWIEYTCSKCSDTYRDPITALGHDYAAVVTPATCEAGGYTTYTCRHDAEHTYVGDETEALGHDWGEWDVTTEAGCETAGEETRVCNHDGTHIETREITATGHDWAESSRQAATCEADGWIEYTCSKCSDTYREPITALGHDYAAVVTPATCEAGGYTTYTCRHDAEHTYVGDETEALGHDWGEWDVTTEAGCETAGEETRVCNHDGTHIETRDIAATGHSWAESSRQAATCEADGWIEYTCSKCSDTYRDPITAIGHAWGEWSVILEPSCTQTGTKQRSCSNCGDVETLILEALGHDWDEGEITTPATCCSEGIITRTCRTCAETVESSVPIDPEAHVWSDTWVVTRYPTCTVDGYETRTCTLDSTHTENRPLEQLGHSWNEGVVTTASTCSSEGVMTYTCTRNHLHTYTAPIAIDPEAHDYVASVVDPTCTEGGYTNHVCSHNPEHSYKTDETEALGHTWGSWVLTTEPTCETDGVITRTCTVCSETQTLPVNMKGHDWDDGVVTPATCEAGGYTTYTCGNDPEHTYIDDETEALGHDWGEWVLTLPPTSIAAGVETRICSRCGETETRPVDKLDYMTGDMDFDGEITVADSLLALRSSIGVLSPTGEQLAAGDIDGDRNVTVADALKILRYATMIILDWD